MADLFHRVSIRKFKDETVSSEDIGYILEAAMAAPSAKNQQPWAVSYTHLTLPTNSRV